MENQREDTFKIKQLVVTQERGAKHSQKNSGGKSEHGDHTTGLGRLEKLVKKGGSLGSNSPRGDPRPPWVLKKI